MPIDPLTALLDIGKTAIEKIWPDANKRAEEIRKLEELRQAGNIKLMEMQVQLLLKQADINLKEAEHKSLFVAGWRPFIGWVGGFGLFWQFVCYPMLCWIWAWARPTYTDAVGQIILIPVPPVLDTTVLMTLITGMLGVGIMRSVDKRNGVATQSLGVN